MKPDDEVAAYLARQLDEPELPDQGFTLAVIARLTKHRRRRRVAFSAAMALAGLIAALVLSPSPGPAVPAPVATPIDLAALLILTAACGWVWLGTEAKPRGA